MDKDLESRSADAKMLDAVQALKDRPALIDRLYTLASAERWRLSQGQFAVVLQRSATKHLASGALALRHLEEYLSALHLEDLALATACCAGDDSAWEHFVNTYRAYLRMAAGAILRCNAAAAEACDLADSLFSELYGLADGKGTERSLFRYFHGRSSLKTWLRAVLAQRHIDSIRAGRRFEELAEDESGDGPARTFLGPQTQPVDPHRERYAASFTRALQAALDRLNPQEKERLRLYYAEEKTLAEIGRLLGEHESSVSRHLDRVRCALRQAVEEILRNGIGAANGSAVQPGMSDAEIALCFECSAGDLPIDLDKLLPRSKSPGPAAGKRTP